MNGDAIREAREALALAKSDPAIRQAIAEAPPLTAEQIAELRRLLPAPGGQA